MSTLCLNCTAYLHHKTHAVCGMGMSVKGVLPDSCPHFEDKRSAPTVLNRGRPYWERFGNVRNHLIYGEVQGAKPLPREIKLLNKQFGVLNYTYKVSKKGNKRLIKIEIILSRGCAYNLNEVIEKAYYLYGYLYSNVEIEEDTYISRNRLTITIRTDKREMKRATRFKKDVRAANKELSKASPKDPKGESELPVPYDRGVGGNSSGDTAASTSVNLSGNRLMPVGWGSDPEVVRNYSGSSNSWIELSNAPQLSINMDNIVRADERGYLYFIRNGERVHPGFPQGVAPP